VYEETLTGRPDDTSVQKATSDNGNVDAIQRHVLDTARNCYNIKLTVRCSSPSRTRNLCSKTAYMMRPIPKEGSITEGTNSSTKN